MELSIYCRVCMNSTFLEYIDLDTPLNDTTYLECFNYCTKLDVVLEDPLPNTICVSCGKSLEIAYEFIKNAHAVDKFLREQLGLVENNTTKEQDKSIDFFELKETKFTKETSPGLVVKEEAEILNTKFDPSTFVIREVGLQEHIQCDALSTNVSDNVTVCNSMQNENITSKCNYFDETFGQAKTECINQKNLKSIKCQKCTNKSCLKQDFEDCSYQNEYENYFKDVWVCKLCGEAFENKAYLNIHEDTDHKGDDVGVCLTCGQSFPDETSLQKHVSDEHGFQVTQESNNSLNTALKDKSQVTQMDPMNDEMYEERKCDECDFATKNKKLWIKHRNGHRKNQHLCAYCPMSFNSAKTLNLHEDYAHGDKKIAPKCTICGKILINKSALRRHYASAHSEERPFECKQCPKRFKVCADLKLHEKRHDSAKRFKCLQCDKAFVMRSDLKVHVRTHTGELPYGCHICGKRFQIKVRLTYHLRRHEGVLYECQECPEKFCSVAMLRCHKFKHNGYPYVCDVCKTGYAKRDHFARHMRSEHEINMTEEDLEKNRLKNAYNYKSKSENEKKTSLEAAAEIKDEGI